jgi:formylglycine-generating enzyme required for sulfatase activity
VVGPKTRQAVAAWQARVGADATGFLAAGQLDQIRRSSRTPGQVFTDTLKDGSPCPFCPEMVVIPAGPFTMGSTPEERKWAVDQGRKEEWYTDEQPAHPVRIAADFALGKTEVTRGQLARFVGATKRNMSGGCYSWTGSDWKIDDAKGWRNPGFDQGDDHPVVCMSWQDAVAYIDWLNQQTGQDYRLPSEAEWEYAARAGSTTMRFWGDDKDSQRACNFANVADRSLKAELNLEPILLC